MNKDKRNSEHTDPENTNGGAKSDNSQNQQTNNKADGKFSVNIEDQKVAKIEMKKLIQSSSVKLKKMKSRISEYQAAKAISDEEASQTEIGMLLNNPDVWGVIANRILS